MSRNANGEGSVWQRKDGRWCAAAYLPVPSADSAANKSSRSSASAAGH
jgi:hypothetical protein